MADLKEHFPEADTLALSWAYYFGAISFIDAWIGVILDELAASGQREETLVIYTADHGELFGDHWAAGKDCFYEGSARVPLLLSWPGRVPGGVVREQLTGLTDVVPTILAATGITAGEHGLEPDGVDLLPVARDDVPTREVWVGQVGREKSGHVAAVTSEWKYMYEAGGGGELLFKYRESGGELRNLAGSEPAVTGELRKAVQAALAEGAETSSGLLDDAAPNGYRDLSSVETSAAIAPVEDSHWLRRAQYPGWVDALPADWLPPTEREAIPADLPRRPDRGAYRWAPLKPEGTAAAVTSL